MENINNCEIWKDITGYKNLYQVSNFGQVRSLHKNHTHLLKPCKQSHGYLQVFLIKDKKRVPFYIHRLVAQAFIPNPDNLPEINHKSEIKSQNYVWVNEDGTIDLDKSNLEWCDRVYNVNYGNRTKKTSRPIKQLTLNGELVYIWSSTREAERNGFNHSNICSCCNNRLKTHMGFKWEYA